MQMYFLRALPTGRVAAFLLLGALLLSACGGSVRDESGSVVAEGRESVFSLRVGDCYDDPASGLEEVGAVRAKPCAEPHDNEVFFLTDYPAADAASFPDTETLLEWGDEQCFAPFETYVGSDYYESELEFFSMVPTARSWREGDREIVCSLFEMEGAKLTGSMHGSGR